MTDRFDPSEVLLLGPGPSPVPPRVSSSMAAPTLGHLDPEFVALMDRVQTDLRTVFGTRNRFTLPISGTGSAGMEAVLTNAVRPGDRVVVGVHGVFGGRLAELARRLGAEVAVVEVPFGEALDPVALRAAIAHGDTSLVAVVHAETSTGVLQPLDDICAAAREHGARMVVDCVTSLGGVAVDLHSRSIDFAFSGTQKCLSVPPGLSPVSVSDAALEHCIRRQPRPPSWYFDFGLLAAYWDAGEASRTYHHTAPVQMVYGLAAGLAAVLEEGLAARYARHRATALALYAGLEALGLECLVADGLRTPMLTTVRVPDGVDEAPVRRFLRTAHRIEIGGGLGPLAGRVWRIGLMGHGARTHCVRRVIAGLGDGLARAGHRVDIAAGLLAVDQAEQMAARGA